MTMYSATFDTSNQFVKYRLTCSLNWQSIPENRSSVRIEIQAWRTNSGYQTYGTGTATFKNYSGTNYNQAIGPSQIISQNSYTVLFSGDYYVNHNADGTASPTYGAQIAIPNIGLSSSMQYHQFTLPTIIRNAVINGITGGAKFGDSATFDLDRISSLYYWMKLKYGSTVLYERAVSGDFSITTNKAWQSYIPNTTQMMITAELKTYADSSMTTQIGSTSSASFTVGLSDDAYPSFTFDANSIDHNGGILSPAVPDIWGMFIQGHSGAIVTVSDAAGAYGSTITGCFISGAGNSINGTTLTTTPIVQAGTINFTAVVTDSRGRSLTKIVSITVVAYSPPRIIDVLSQRADTVSHLAVSDGEGALVYCDYDFLSLSGNNSVSTSLKYRESGTTPWIDIEDVSFLDGVAAYIDATGGFDVAKSYDIQYLVTDALSTTTHTDLLSMARPVLEFNPAGEVGIGQEPVAGKALSVFGDVNVDGRLSIFGVDIDTNGVITGSIIVNISGGVWETKVLDLSPYEFSSPPYFIPCNGDVYAQPDGQVVNANSTLLADSSTEVTVRIIGRAGGFRINFMAVHRIEDNSGGGQSNTGVLMVNGIEPTAGNVNVSIKISQAAYDLIAEPDPNVTYYIY